MPLLYAAAISLAIALLAAILRTLTTTGALAAAIIGTAILWPTGWPGLAVLGVYFATTTLVSRLSSRARAPAEDAGAETRNHRQVLANGGWAAAGALLDFAVPGLGLWTATVALAASAGDTWATAVGSLSPRPPRDILSRRVVPAGTSGGVTWFGSSGGLMGAALVGLTGTMATGLPELFLVAGLTGQLAMAADSILGSALQARFHCPACGKATERPIHGCGAVATLTRGPRWIDNDVVNAMVTGGAFGLALLGWFLFSPRS
jgi:uncharacterized protein (TIGR00297 family)